MLRSKIIKVVIAVAALSLVASAAYAAIPSANGTITACKDSKGALKVIDTEAGQTCNANQQLLNWNQQGPAGPAGPAGQSGVSGRQVTTTSSAYDSSAEKIVYVPCPSGKMPVGGGATVETQVSSGYDVPDGVAIVVSVPNGAGWSLRARELVPTAQGWFLRGYVVCVEAL
jgi:hypothetical protein